jgi:ATP-dependent DNA helicase DinG
MITTLEKNAIGDYYRAIAANLSGFRPRAAQREMLAAIANAFSRTQSRNSEDEEAIKREGESIIVVEGPTGVGKSLAYLLAGGVMAKSRGKKLIVTSATIALQEQLAGRDLPFLIDKSGIELTFALAKGRARYACPYRLFGLTATHGQGQLLADDPLLAMWEKKPDVTEVATLGRLADLLYHRAWDGDRDTLADVVPDETWMRITNDRHGCLKAACPNKPECPFFLARDTLETVDVIVANHDLMLADIGMGGGVVLPAPADSFYCIDEAHHLASKSINQFAAEHSLNQSLIWLEKVQTLAPKLDAVIDKTELIGNMLDAAVACIETLKEWEWIAIRAPELAVTGDDLSPIWLFNQGILPDNLHIPAANMALAARSLDKCLTQLSDALALARKNKPQDALVIDKVTNDLGMIIGRLEALSAVWNQFEIMPEPDAPPVAKWITRVATGKDDFLFSASPVSAAAKLASNLWHKAAGVLLTSATLRSLGDFDLLRRETGLIWFGATTYLALASPFDFPNQGELYLPPMQSSPKDSVAHTAELIDWLPKLVNLTEPVGTLVLFSSRKQMKTVAEGLIANDEDWKTVLLLQGDLAKSTLLSTHHDRIANNKPSVIFGLDSFAEGLDLPLEACVHVILAKLPFAMPDDPVAKTLSRWIEARGGNPFMELTVPQASIKLVQAVGRLIRTEEDYGRITIMDNRLTTQRYGKRLLDALPPFKRL